MDVNVFYSYSLNERMDLLRTGGEYISRIPFYGYIASLYIYEGSYVEIYYDRKIQGICHIELLEHTHQRLNKYAVFVDLYDLYH